MQVLELEPLKKKKLKIILVESEFGIDWWIDPPLERERDLFQNLKFISKEYMQLIRGLIKKYNPHFAVEERGIRTDEEFLYDNPLIDVFKWHKIPYKMVDIQQNALDYITTSMERDKSFLKEIKTEILNRLSQEKVPLHNLELQKLIQWGRYLQEVSQHEENQIRYEIREAWMLMEVLELAKIREEKQITALMICDKEHFDGIANLADELGIELLKIELKKSFKNTKVESVLNELLNHSILELIPIQVKKKKEKEKILFFFDTDDYASPFDINMAYDAGFNIVVPFNKVTARSVEKLVQDAIFSRGPKAPTAFFIGGSNVDEGEKIAKKVVKALVPPFETSVIIDPRGSYTTASAVVAKTLALAGDHGIKNITGKKVVVMGTGPVGRIAAILAAKLHCHTVLVETWDKASKVAVKNLAMKLTQEAGEDASKIIGEFTITDDQKFELLKDADIIWAVAAAGVQIIPRKIIDKLPPNKIMIDINAIPPMGIESLKPKHDNIEFAPGIYGTGALALGALKYKIENNILKQATNIKGKKIFDYNLAFETAQLLLQGEKISISTNIKRN